MAVRLIPLNDRVLKDDGAPASDGSYKFYLAGSTTPVTVYSDRGLTSSLGSSVPIDAEGYPTYVNVWGADDVSYKIGIQATGYNDGVEKFFDYAAVATSAVVDNSDATPAFKNLLNNGGPSNWTGGTSFSNISGSAAAVEIADDWFFSQNGTASNAISRQTGDGQTARYAMRVGRPAASVSVETLRVYQALPTDNAYQCRGKTITVSFSLKKGADFSGGSVGVLIATGTTEGESGNLMATGGWGGFVTALSTTQAPSATSTRYQFSAALQSNIKEAGLQLSYTPTGTAGSNDWIQIEDTQWEVASAATDFAARPEPIEFLLGNLSPYARTLLDDVNAAAALATLGIGANRPYFRANKNGTNQTGIADITNTKVTFTTEAVDNGGYYDTTNSRWTPPAGPVQIEANVTITGTFVAGLECRAFIYKNGADFMRSSPSHTASTGGGTVSVSIMDVANGTDYYEIYVYGDVSSGTITVSGSTILSSFTGIWLG